MRTDNPRDSISPVELTLMNASGIRALSPNLVRRLDEMESGLEMVAPVKKVIRSMKKLI